MGWLASLEYALSAVPESLLLGAVASYSNTGLSMPYLKKPARLLSLEKRLVS